MENVITLSKLIDLFLLFCPHTLCFVFENLKNTRNELARPVMGTIFLVMIIIIIVSMNKSQELTVFHGRQKLTSAKN